MRFLRASAGTSPGSVLIQSPDNANLAPDSNPTLPKRNGKRHVKLSGGRVSKQPGWIPGLPTPGRQGMPSAADMPGRLSLPSDPGPGYTVPTEGQPGATAAHAAPKTPQVEGDEVPAIPLLPSSVVPTTPGSRPHGTGWVPALEPVCRYADKGQGRAGRRGQGGERPARGLSDPEREETKTGRGQCVRTCRAGTCRDEWRGLQCIVGTGRGLREGQPGVRRGSFPAGSSPAPFPSARPANQVLWEGHTNPPPPGAKVVPPPPGEIGSFPGTCRKRWWTPVLTVHAVPHK